MNKFLLAVISLTVLFICGHSLAQDIYVYPNKRLADQGLIEYRRYTLDEARVYQRGGSFEPYLITGWTAERQLTRNQEPYWPQTVNSGESIYSTYYSMNDGRLNYISSSDAGVNWTSNLFLGDTSGDKAYYFPDICINNQELLIISDVYNFNEHGRRPVYFRSANNGATWGIETSIISYDRLNQTDYISAANLGRNVFVSYNEFDHDSIYVIRSWNFGTNWIGTGVNVAFLNSTPQPMSMAASDSIVHLVWVNENAPISIRYSRSTDNGVTWSPELDVSQDSLGAQLCRISADGQHVIVSWMSYKYSPYMLTGDMFVRQSFDGGVTWDTAQVLTESHKVTLSDNFIKDSAIVIGWMDSRLDNHVNIFTKYSNDFGVSWHNEEQASIGGYSSGSLSIFMIEQIINVLWGDRRPIVPGLYYNYNNMNDGIDESNNPINNSLFSAYPNPFNSYSVITFPEKNSGNIRIFNIAGQLVKTLNCSGKEGLVIWNGTDDNGQSLSSGVYLVMAKTSLGMQHLKITYLK